jgi:hypothetical protein
VNRRSPEPAPLTLVVLSGPGREATLESVRAQTVPPLEVFLEDPPGASLGATGLRAPGRHPAGILGGALAGARGAWLQAVAPGVRLQPTACGLAMDQVRAHPRAGLFLADAALAGDPGDRVLPALDWRAAAGTFSGMELAELRSHGPEWPQTPVLLGAERLREAGGFPADLAWHGLWWATHLLGFRHGATYDPAQADLLAPFALSGALGAFGADLGEVYLGDPALWRESLSLVLGPCLDAHRRRKPQFLDRSGPDRGAGDLDARTVAALQSLLSTR